jgi:hypothetical protein
VPKSGADTNKNFRVMIILTSIDSLCVELDSAVTTNEMQCVSSWRDITASTYIAGRNVTNTNGVVTVNIVDSPETSTQRIVDFMSIYNNDTVSKKVRVFININETEYTLCYISIDTCERLEYTDCNGFSVYTSTGSRK